MNLTSTTKALVAAGLMAAASLASAVTVTDALGDYVAGFTGSRIGDLDVLSAFVTYNQGTDKFVFSGTFAADVGSTPGGFYIWGVNRGNGMAAFAGNGLPNVLFDITVRINQNGAIVVGGNTVGTAAIIGSTIVGQVDGSLLPSTGFAKQNYTWNLWPRDATLAGFAAISDFAPDNTNAAVTVIGAVPEPQTIALLAAGLIGLVGWKRLRKD